VQPEPVLPDGEIVFVAATAPTEPADGAAPARRPSG
jgi:hypothetical protein